MLTSVVNFGRSDVFYGEADVMLPQRCVSAAQPQLRMLYQCARAALCLVPTRCRVLFCLAFRFLNVFACAFALMSVIFGMFVKVQF